MPEKVSPWIDWAAKVGAIIVLMAVFGVVAPFFRNGWGGWKEFTVLCIVTPTFIVFLQAVVCAFGEKDVAIWRSWARTTYIFFAVFYFGVVIVYFAWEWLLALLLLMFFFGLCVKHKQAAAKNR